MISDTLSDAILTIEEYRKELPQCYDCVRNQLDHLVEVMTAYRVALDTPGGLLWDGDGKTKGRPFPDCMIKS